MHLHTVSGIMVHMKRQLFSKERSRASKAKWKDIPPEERSLIARRTVANRWKKMSVEDRKAYSKMMLKAKQKKQKCLNP